MYYSDLYGLDHYTPALEQATWPPDNVIYGDWFDGKPDQDKLDMEVSERLLLNMNIIWLTKKGAHELFG